MVHIICAANWYNIKYVFEFQPRNIKHGMVVCGRRHHNIIYTFCELTGEPRGDDCIQGFMTSDDRFVDRKEAAKIAFAAKQIPEMKRELYSEDIY